MMTVDPIREVGKLHMEIVGLREIIQLQQAEIEELKAKQAEVIEEAEDNDGS